MRNFDAGPSGGHDREFAVHVPPSYNENTPSSVILSYHGHGSNMTAQEAITGFSDTSVNSKAIVIYPQGVQRSWQSAPYADPAISDLDFTVAMLAYMNETYCVDPSRIYATGQSNGGGFVDLLVCSPQTSNYVAAFGISSAALYSDLPSSTCLAPAGGGGSGTGGRKRTHVIEFHGSADRIIPYDGGAVLHDGGNYTLPSISEWLGRWGERNRCEFPPAVRNATFDRGKTGRITTYDCQGMDGVVVGYEDFGQGHCWPEDRPGIAGGCDHGFDASAVMLEFFERWGGEGGIEGS